MTARRAHWEEVYAAKPANQVSWYQQSAEPSLRMIRAAGVPLRAAIIDIGGGASVLADELLADGFQDVSVLDIAEQALVASKSRLGAGAANVHWIIADILSWNPARKYDLWHDRAVFHFLTAEQDRAAYRHRLAQGLGPDGSLILAAFAPDGPERCSGLPIQRWSAQALAAELGPQFELVESYRDEHRTPSDAVQAFTWTRFRRL